MVKWPSEIFLFDHNCHNPSLAYFVVSNDAQQQGMKNALSII